VDGPLGVQQFRKLCTKSATTFFMEGTLAKDVIASLDDGNVRKVAVAVGGVLRHEPGVVFTGVTMTCGELGVA